MSSPTELETPLTALVGGSRTELTEDVVEEAVTRVVASSATVRRMSPAERARILDAVAADLEAEAGVLAGELASEARFLTRQDMVLEVERAVDVFRMSAAVARNGLDEVVNLEGSPRGGDTLAVARRVPYGPMLAITAFNGPILIAAHKIAPAIVAGTPVVLKPSPRVPRAAVLFAERVIAAGWPADALAVLPVGNEATMDLVRDPRLPVISFTGGDVGWAIKDAAPRKHVHLELGGVGALIVAADADVEEVAAQCVAGGFVRSGQACLSVQRVYAQGAVYEPLVARLTELIGALRTGDPEDPSTDVGPLVDEAAADRVERLVSESVADGASLLAGGGRDGAFVEPTLLADTTEGMAVLRREVFGPVIAVSRVGDLAEAVRQSNSAGGALHVGVFTRDIDAALDLFDDLDAGGVIVNGSNAWRVDNMPYGGTGNSGFGREGVRYMVEEITERKTLVIRRRGRQA